MVISFLCGEPWLGAGSPCAVVQKVQKKFRLSSQVNLMKLFLRLALLVLLCGMTAFAVQIAPQVATQRAPRITRVATVAPAATAPIALERPYYRLHADVDWELLTFRSSARIAIPVAAGDSLRDVSFFIYGNANGVGGNDARRKSIAVDRVSFAGRDVPFQLNGAVLKVQLPQPQAAPFELEISSHGVVPRAPEGAGGLADMMGGLGGLGGSLGGDDDGGLGALGALDPQMLEELGLAGLVPGANGKAPKAAPSPKKPDNTDYGLFTFGNGVLSLGSFWYPQLAVRQNGKWTDEAPEGLGDVAYAVMSDYDVTLNVPQSVTVAATGNRATTPSNNAPGRKTLAFRANNARDFSVLMSEDWLTKSTTFDVGGRSVQVEAFTLKKDAAKADQAIDFAGHALQIYARRFGPYLYDNFKVVQGPIRGGAGGMEFTGLTSIASMLYGDWGKELGQLAASLGAGGGLGGLFGAAEGTAPQKGAHQLPDNAASEMLNSLLGGQKDMLDSVFEMTIAHEVAHQWWAIGVGNDSQRAPFVDESLANYTAILYFEDRYGKERAQQMMDTHLKQTYSMGRMMGGPDRPANLRTSAYAGNVQYGAVVYGKGALFYDALRRTAGDTAFFDALRTYYARYHNGLAAPRDFINILKTKAPKANADGLYARWIEQAHGDDDISGGKPLGLDSLLGGMLGGLTGGDF